MKRVCFLGPKYDQTVDHDLFDSDDQIIHISESDKTVAHLLAACGRFDSVSQARKSGWDIPIPTGWTEYVIGKNKGANRLDVFIWNPEWTLEEFNELDAAGKIMFDTAK